MGEAIGPTTFVEPLLNNNGHAILAHAYIFIFSQYWFVLFDVVFSAKDTSG